MLEMHFPWLEIAILLPLVGGLLCLRDRLDRGRMISLVITGLTLLATLCAWQDFLSLHQTAAHDHWYFAHKWLGDQMLVIDELSAPLLSLATLTYLVTLIATVKAKSRRFSYSGTMFSLSLLMATLSSRESWLLVGLLALGCVPPWIELRARGRSTRIFTLHMGLFLTLLCLGGDS